MNHNDESGTTEMNANTNDRIPPLNLTEEEAAYLWEMCKREVGKEEVQYSDRRETAESIHTKVRKLAVAAGETER